MGSNKLDIHRQNLRSYINDIKYMNKLGWQYRYNFNDYIINRLGVQSLPTFLQISTVVSVVHLFNHFYI